MGGQPEVHIEILSQNEDNILTPTKNQRSLSSVMGGATGCMQRGEQESYIYACMYVCNLQRHTIKCILLPVTKCKTVVPSLPPGQISSHLTE